MADSPPQLGLNLPMPFVIEERVSGDGIDKATEKSDEVWQELRGGYLVTRHRDLQLAQESFKSAKEWLPDMMPGGKIRLVQVIDTFSLEDPHAA